MESYIPYKDLKLSKVVVFDLETSGLDCYTDKIIEVSAVKYIDGKQDSIFSELVDPHIEIDGSICRLTGISNDMLRGNRDISQILPDFLSFIDDAVLVGHNIDFDLSFLKHNIYIYDLEKSFISDYFIDTVTLSRIMAPIGPINYKLASLVKYFNLKNCTFHRALEDASATGDLFWHIIQISLSLPLILTNKLAFLCSQSNTDFLKIFFANLANYQRKMAQEYPLKFHTAQKSYNYIHKKEILESQRDILRNKNILDDIFKEKGILNSQLPFYERREQQETLANSVRQVQEFSQILMAEAGTGVGKSYAYLIPSIIYAILNNQRIIISTNTKNLQEQLFLKDLPLLSQVFAEGFDALLVKGRSNYLCLKKFTNILKYVDTYLAPSEIKFFLPLLVWEHLTETGDIEECRGFNLKYNYILWTKLQSETGYCSGKKCQFYKKCYLQRVRSKIHTTNIIIVNHSLLFSDLSSENVVLGNYKHLVIDEAHNIENSVTNFMGIEYSLLSFKIQLNNIISKDEKNGALFRLEKAISRITILEQNIADRLNDLMTILRDKKNNLYEHGEEFFEKIIDRILKNNSDNKKSNQFIKERFKDSNLFFENLDDEKRLFKSLTEELINILSRIVTLLKDIDEKSNFKDLEEIISEFVSLHDHQNELYDSFLFFENTKRENYVFWYEVEKTVKKSFFKICSAPLDISPILKNKLYDNLDSVVLTSATLTIENRFKYSVNKLGLGLVEKERLCTKILGSPYKEDQQLQVIAPSYFATPKKSSLFEDDMHNLLKMLFKNFNSGSLVLFTNNKQMYQCGDILKQYLGKERTILVQGKDGSRSDIITSFREDISSILLGTNSFWEGIDVPGNSLESLIITKLPFSVPTEPIVQARIEKLEEQGKNSFMYYSVPETILKFKQGVGRVIRNSEDRGIIYILDSRVINTRWGRAFINSLPVKPKIARNLDEVKQITHQGLMQIQKKPIEDENSKKN